MHIVLCVLQLQMLKFVLLVFAKFMPAAALKDKKPLDVDFKNRERQFEGIITIKSSIHTFIIVILCIPYYAYTVHVST